MDMPSAMRVTAFMRTERSADEIGLSENMGTPVLKLMSEARPFGEKRCDDRRFPSRLAHARASDMK